MIIAIVVQIYIKIVFSAGDAVG